MYLSTEVEEKMSDLEDTPKLVSIDEMLVHVGEYGRFQQLINFILCIMSLPPVFHVMIMFFAADDPDWKCSANATKCTPNATYSSNDERKCRMNRSDWEYTKPPAYSLVVYFDIHCKDKWLLELLTSIFFLGWLLGAFILGWVCDNYGRKLVLIVSTNVIMVMGFVCIFMPNIYLIILCRFIIGFFLPGTFIQSFIVMTELVGVKYKAFAGLMIFVSVIGGITLIGVKAYFIRDWKYLHIACTAPYIFIVFFFHFIPESVRYLRVKGQMDELAVVMRRIAYWNRTAMPSDMVVAPPSVAATKHKSNPAHLFRTRKLTTKTSIQIFAYFTSGLVYYGVFLAAGELGGSMYRNYILISGSEVPIIFLSMHFCEKYGRKKTSMFPMLFSCFACVALSFLPNKSGNHAYQIARVATGLIGKSLVGSNMNTMSTWSTELYTTQIRGEAIGFFQAFTRLGASTTPWVDKELAKIDKSASFLFMAVFSLLSFLLLGFLPETQGLVTADSEEEEDEEKNESKLRLMVEESSDEEAGECSYSEYQSYRTEFAPERTSTIETIDTIETIETID